LCYITYNIAYITRIFLPNITRQGLFIIYIHKPAEGIFSFFKLLEFQINQETLKTEENF